MRGASAAGIEEGPNASRRGSSYDLVGYLEADSGLAVAARNTFRVLEATGRSVCRLPVAPGGARHAPAAPSDGRRITLFHLNPLDLAISQAQWRAAVDPAAPRACVPFWELPLLPHAWLPLLRAMDAVLAPTRFVQEACARVVGAERALYLPQAVFLPKVVEPDRRAFGLEEGSTLFVVSFDAASGFERKNPMAAVEAFRRAFPSGEDVRLAVKAREERGSKPLAALRALAAADRRITLLDRDLPYAEVLRLYASADVLVSTHRSEGLGLHLMEVMSLGKVVVATGWSGNTDFMTRENSVPLGYRLVPVATAHGHYRREVGRVGQVWAEPDLDEAVAALQALHRDPARRRVLGEAGARDMESRRQAALAGGAFNDLEALLARSRNPAARGFGRALLGARVRAVLGVSAEALRGRFGG